MKISIIIATYNASKTLNRCLDSIVSQKNSEVELIIIDGGSTDETLSVINSYSSDIDYVLSEKDNGLYDAWNKGIKAAKGDWIMFLGADDQLLSNALEKYIE
ncbi:MAG: glycosyltransferase, partial [Paludibacteraceae bacterium]|nr:glycosyltransferase [Paludibacteraceae bacterium]